MPKWKSNKITENKGIIFLENIVNQNGSIFRSVPGDKDTGIDGFVEFVDNENVKGELIAVQVKSGDSFYNKKNREFEIYVDEEWLRYWDNYMLPVILIFYSPTYEKGAWVPISEFIKHEKYHNNVPIRKVWASLNDRELTINNFNNLRNYAKMKFDSQDILLFLNSCLSDDENEAYNAFIILTNHPDSRGSKITLLVARNLIKLDNIEILKRALFILGYGVGRDRWSFNPNNLQEKKISGYACELCSDLSREEIYKLLCLTDVEAFHGPEGLGERFFDVISCCWEKAERILIEVSSNKNEPIQRRINALYLLYECDYEKIKDDYDAGTYSQEYRDLFERIFCST